MGALKSTGSTERHWKNLEVLRVLGTLGGTGSLVHSALCRPLISLSFSFLPPFSFSLTLFMSLSPSLSLSLCHLFLSPSKVSLVQCLSLSLSSLLPSIFASLSIFLSLQLKLFLSFSDSRFFLSFHLPLLLPPSFHRPSYFCPFVQCCLCPSPSPITVRAIPKLSVFDCYMS